MRDTWQVSQNATLAIKHWSGDSITSLRLKERCVPSLTSRKTTKTVKTEANRREITRRTENRLIVQRGQRGKGKKLKKQINSPHRLPFRFYTLWNRKKHSCFPPSVSAVPPSHRQKRTGPIEEKQRRRFMCWSAPIRVVSCDYIIFSACNCVFRNCVWWVRERPQR